MATQHTSFIQPQFLISHYQILLNSIQPSRIVGTAKEVLFTLCKIWVCLCTHALVPGAEWILTQGQSLFLGEEDFCPEVGLASTLSDKPFTSRAGVGAHYSLHQHKQVTSSHNSALWLYSTLTKVVVILIHGWLFKDKHPGRVKLGCRYVFLEA